MAGRAPRAGVPEGAARFSSSDALGLTPFAAGAAAAPRDWLAPERSRAVANAARGATTAGPASIVRPELDANAELDSRAALDRSLGRSEVAPRPCVNATSTLDSSPCVDARSELGASSALDGAPGSDTRSMLGASSLDAWPDGDAT
jgi:hypothetical protein